MALRRAESKTCPHHQRKIRITIELALSLRSPSEVLVLSCKLFASFVLLSTCSLLGCGSETGAGTKPVPEVPPKFDYPLDDVLRFHHLQTKSTHNSFHVETEGNTLEDWNYTHAPLDVQMGEQGVRHVELDIRFNEDLGIFEVYHLPILDEQTTCREFTKCLSVLKKWSDGHRAHHMIVVQLEMRSALADETAEPYFDALHKEIRSVWPEDRLFTPDELQGDFPTLRDAVKTNGWPTLGELRGQLMFTLDDAETNRQFYTRNLTSLAGRIIFANSAPSDPWAAIAILNNPVTNAQAISEALAANLLVRSFVDASVEVRQAALDGGVHFMTTDYPAPVAGMDYWFDLPGGTPSRCNVVTAPAECTSEAIEDPKFVGP